MPNIDSLYSMDVVVVNDIKEIEEVLNNLDVEIDAYINSQNFEKSKVEWLIDHTKKITAIKKGRNKNHYVIELDLLAGAIIAGKDFQLFVNSGAHHRIQTTDRDLTAEIRFVA